MWMERMADSTITTKLGRLIIQTLALLGGLAGLLIAALQLLASLVGLSSSHIPLRFERDGSGRRHCAFATGPGRDGLSNSLHEEQNQSPQTSPLLQALGLPSWIYRVDLLR